jgi:hypothetical protein
VFNDVNTPKLARRRSNDDPYYLQKVIKDWNKSSLRLMINDDRAESFQLWGVRMSLVTALGKEK